jgi:hypothetical protein
VTVKLLQSFHHLEDLILQEFLLVDSLAYLPLRRYMQCWGIALLVHIGLDFEARD